MNITTNIQLHSFTKDREKHLFHSDTFTIYKDSYTYVLILSATILTLLTFFHYISDTTYYFLLYICNIREGKTKDEGLFSDSLSEKLLSI